MKVSMTKAIVITSIFPPTPAVKKFASLTNKGFTLYNAGDNKTPKNWKVKNTVFLSIHKQHSQFSNFSHLVAENHYARKNLAYLKAIKDKVGRIYESDDDNIAYDFFPCFIEKRIKLSQISAKPAFNVYSLFIDKKIWPRGLPLNAIKKSTFKIKQKEVQSLIQQSLVDLDPDVDAIYRLTNGELVTFDRGKVFAIAKGTYCPFNSQNTYWHPQVFPLLYLPSTVESRVTDIWRGYIAQRILWELDSELIFSSPSVYQERNVHNYMKDFRQESDLYLRVEELLQTLSKISLHGSVSEMLLTIYKKLVKRQFFQESELEIVNQWLTEVS